MRIPLLRKYIIACGLATSACFGQTHWFTGPIVVLSGEVIPKGHINVEPFLFQFWNSGWYNEDWKRISTPTVRSTNPQLCISRGFAQNFDVEIIPQMFFNQSGSAQSWRMGDFPFILGFQALWQKPGTWIPSLRITLQETFPSGQYNKFTPSKQLTQSSGAGSYQTSLGLNFQKLISFDPIHALQLYWSLTYTVPSPTHVNGLNFYGGDPKTNGTVYPGKLLQAIVSFEYNFTKHWAVACDVVNLWREADRFSGKTTVKSRRGSGYNLSLAPGIEYNVNGNLGFIFGSWLSAAGRNSFAFTSAVFTVNYYH
ncbi:MAG: hypothetical protein KDK44_01955 [Chlamydiia bacterium]|nr:hypothetical protein [Chlamydiia bacterium]